MILIIDGNNIAYRTFHTPAGSLETTTGKPSGVIFGFLKSIKTYLDKFPEATRMIVVWDGGKAKWRKDIYPEYKANRSYGDDPEEKAKFDGLFSQIDTLHEFLPKMGVHSIKLKGWEADDIIAQISNTITNATKLDKTGLIVTSDKDMLQLVSKRVSVYTPNKGGKIISPLNFYEETGVTQEAYIGYRAIVGDTSDNIIGINGIGEKTAKGLMDKYGHIDNILNAQGDDKKALLKSARTKRIFEDEGLKCLAINNKIMNFKFVPQDDEVETQVSFALGDDPAGIHQVPQFQSSKFKAFCIQWQFLDILTNYLPFITPFMALGEED